MLNALGASVLAARGHHCAWHRGRPCRARFAIQGVINDFDIKIMSFIIKKSGSSARLIRRIYVPRGGEGNTHAFYKDTNVGSLRLTATELPVEFPPLSESETRRVEAAIFQPARAAAARAEQDRLDRQQDPAWRVREAVRLLGEVRTLSRERPVDVGSVDSVAALLNELTIDGERRLNMPDPLEAVTQAARLAVEAIREGHYGTNDAGAGMRDSPAGVAWTRLRETVLDNKEDSIKAVLQQAGWVKSRGGSGN